MHRKVLFLVDEWLMVNGHASFPKVLLLPSTVWGVTSCLLYRDGITGSRLLRLLGQADKFLALGCRYAKIATVSTVYLGTGCVSIPPRVAELKGLRGFQLC